MSVDNIKKPVVQSIAMAVLCVVVMTYLYFISISSSSFSAVIYAVLLALGFVSLLILLNGLRRSIFKA